ncbi:hypothetical protein [Streptomyces sp. NPDC013171]|uniref:hypothetical protein n=1 Tax=Streptomyces sp. NPDC013171 TaxID=3364863 RepID=UPI003680D364
MSTSTGGFAAPREAADAIVDEILRRRLTAADARRRDRCLRTPRAAVWSSFQDVALRTEAEVEERGLLLALAHLLGDEDGPEEYVRESVRRRHLTSTVPGAATGEVVLSHEGLALKPS